MPQVSGMARKCRELTLIFCTGGAPRWDPPLTDGDDWGGGSNNAGADAGGDDSCRM